MSDTATQLDQDRLQKIVGMMSSDNAGERANAAQMFVQALGRAGMSHGDLAFKKAPPRSPRDPDLKASNIGAEARRYLRETQEYFAEWDAERAEINLEYSAQNFVRVMDRMREDSRLLHYEIGVLQSFVSPEVIRIAKSRIEIEKARASDESWRARHGKMEKDERTYPKGPGCRPGWVKDKPPS